jgi:hypothetical protein
VGEITVQCNETLEAVIVCPADSIDMRASNSELATSMNYRQLRNFRGQAVENLSGAIG